MGIFKIQQQAPKGIEDATQSATTPLPTTEDKPGTSTDQLTGSEEKKIELIQINEKGPEGKEGNKEEGEVTVNISGSLSSVFTDSLNQLLAVESYVTMIPQDKGNEGWNPPAKPMSDVLRVYCWDGDALNMDDVLEITNQISRSTSDEFVIAIEGMKAGSVAIGAIERLSALKNVEVCYTRGKALQLVKEKIVR